MRPRSPTPAFLWGALEKGDWMLTMEAWSYLALLFATCGAYAAGRGATGAFRWARRGALVLLAAVLVTVQVRLVSFGLVTHWAGLLAAGVALAGVLALMGLDLLHDATRRAAPAPR